MGGVREQGARACGALLCDGLVRERAHNAHDNPQSTYLNKGGQQALADSFVDQLVAMSAHIGGKNGGNDSREDDGTPWTNELYRAAFTRYSAKRGGNAAAQAAEATAPNAPKAAATKASKAAATKATKAAATKASKAAATNASKAAAPDASKAAAPNASARGKRRRQSSSPVAPEQGPTRAKSARNNAGAKATSAAKGKGRAKVQEPSTIEIEEDEVEEVPLVSQAADKPKQKGAATFPYTYPDNAKKAPSGVR